MGDITILGLPISIGTMIYQAFIFTVLTFLLKKFVIKRLINVMDTRKHHIERQLQTAEKYQHEAEQTLELSQKTLKQAKRKAIEILSHSEQEAELIIKEAKTEARRIITEAKEEARFARSRFFTPKDHNKGA